jgi:hypothetical protein
MGEISSMNDEGESEVSCTMGCKSKDLKSMENYVEQEQQDFKVQSKTKERDHIFVCGVSRCSQPAPLETKYFKN